MLSIFQKKIYLKDLLEGLPDIHNHLLPGIDDGAGTIEDSLELLKKMKHLGYNSFICTPHIMNDYYPNTPETINSALAKLQEAIKDDPELKTCRTKAAAEYMMDQSFMDLLDKEKMLPLTDKYLLVEMSYFQAPINLKEILFKIQTQGYRPVLAHPERYAFYHGKDLQKYEELKNRGCLMQLNALSLSTHYGSNMQYTAFKLLEAGMIDFIGSDTHRMQHLEKLEAIKLSKKQAAQLKPVIEKTKEQFEF
ncbi:MAG TPA: CpsB/CapC family capsule biosynthesis tyrosine phosphatase [Gillisia sp.]|nr:CpsB/CapC family capsule biosynthesis tyrosine phosphatase [Gillisia sp.]